MLLVVKRTIGNFETKMSIAQISLADHYELPDVIEVLEELGLDMEDLDEDDWMVAKVNNEVVGVGRLRFYDDACELASIGVLEEHRGKGIGSSIINALLEQDDSEKVFVVTEIQSYFERFGFNITSDFPDSILQKLQRCSKELNCQSPSVMVTLINRC